jgi:hypothetical protein
MTRSELLQFMRGHLLAVQTSVSPSAAPQAAVVGIVVTDDFEIFFDTLEVTRKMHNLRLNPKIAFIPSQATAQPQELFSKGLHLRLTHF